MQSCRGYIAMQLKYIFIAFGALLLGTLLAGRQPAANRNTNSPSVCEAGNDCSSSPVAVSRGAVFYNHVPVGVVKLDAQTGKPLWTFSPPKGWVASNLLTLGSRVFFAGNTAGPCAPVYAMGTGTRQIEWSKDYGSCPIWSDGRRLYLQGGNGDGDGVIAVDPSTGKELWHAEGETPRFVQALVVSNGRLYTNDRVLDAQTGKTLFWWPKDSDVSGLAATNARVFIGGYIAGHHGVLSAYDATTLEKEWQATLLAGKHIVSIVAAGELVYAVGYAGNATSARVGVLQAFDTRTGQPEWSYQIHSCCQDLDASPVSVGEGALFLLKPADAQSGTELVALDPATGKPLWSFQSVVTLQGPPYAHGGRVYVEDSQSRLISLDAATGKIIWVYKP